MKFCDLHTHSNISDGSDTPAEIIDEALKLGLSAIALCDHNTVLGLPEFLSAAEGKDITAVPGAEFSVDLNGKEIHLLGLFIPTDAFVPLSEMMEAVNKRKEQSNIQLVAALNEAGYKIDYDKLRSSHPTGIFNRSHVGDALVEAGYVSSKEEAFAGLLDSSYGYYKEYKRISVWEMIDTLKSLGAVPVLAHPLKQLSDRELEVFLPKAKETGLAGMECYYSEYTPEQTETAMKLARHFGIKYSGGSDYHGKKKANIMLGRGLGDLYVPGEWAEILAN